MWAKMKQSEKLFFPAPAVHGNFGKTRMSREVRIAYCWMIEFVNIFGERLPHQQKRVCINAFKYSTEIYKQMKCEQFSNGYDSCDLCSPTQFYRLIRKKFGFGVDMKVGKVLTYVHALFCKVFYG